MRLRTLDARELPDALRREYEQARGAALRRRLMWFSFGMGGLLLLIAGIVLVASAVNPGYRAIMEPWDPFGFAVLGIANGIGGLALVAGGVALARGRLAAWNTDRLVLGLAVTPAACDVVVLAAGAPSTWGDLNVVFAGVAAGLVIPTTPRIALHALGLVAIPCVLLGLFFGAMAGVSGSGEFMPMVTALAIAGWTAPFPLLVRWLDGRRRRDALIDLLAARPEAPSASEFGCSEVLAREYIRQGEIRAAYNAEAARIFRPRALRLAGWSTVACAAMLGAKMILARFAHGVSPLPGLLGNLELTDAGLLEVSLPYDLAACLLLGSVFVVLMRYSPQRFVLRWTIVAVFGAFHAIHAFEALDLASTMPIERERAFVFLFLGALVSQLVVAMALPWRGLDVLLLSLAAGVSAGLTGLLVAMTGGAPAADPLTFAIYGGILSTLCGVPAWVAATWRQGRFREQFTSTYLVRRERELYEELSAARRLHDSLFPSQSAGGPVQLVYRYEPMRHIGGDFLFRPATRAGEPASVVLLDVTGHGIPAAITVHQLVGELRRLYADDPKVNPAQVLCALNRYIHTSTALYSVYATGIVATLDPERDTLTLANAGHPPAFVRSLTGELIELDATAWTLGVSADGTFEVEQHTIPFRPGDALLMYTDGATEARDAQGRMLRVASVRTFLTRAMVGPTLLPDELLRLVRMHREGPPADDTLIAVLHRPQADVQVEVSMDATPASRVVDVSP